MRIVAVLLGLALVACSPAPAPVANDARDPSNPRAPEGIDPVAAIHTLPPSAPAATTYACPMHPEVTSEHEGKCPKCGMTLVPKK